MVCRQGTLNHLPFEPTGSSLSHSPPITLCCRYNLFDQMPFLAVNGDINKWALLWDSMKRSVVRMCEVALVCVCLKREVDPDCCLSPEI